MLPFLAGGLVIATVVWLLDDGEDEKETKGSSSSSIKKTILEENFYNLGQQLRKNKTEKKVIILGQPGAGKSSLLLNITDNKCVPKPIIGVQTDATHWHHSIKYDFFHRHEKVIYVDSPGYDTNSHPVESYINHFPFSSFDIIIFVISGKIHHSDQKIIEKVGKINSFSPSTKLIIVRNFNENLNDQDRNKVETDMKKHFQSKSEKLDFIFSSNRTTEGIETIKKLVNM